MAFIALSIPGIPECYVCGQRSVELGDILDIGSRLRGAYVLLRNIVGSRNPAPTMGEKAAHINIALALWIDALPVTLKARLWPSYAKASGTLADPDRKQPQRPDMRPRGG